MPLIATWTPDDALLDVMVPLGLAVCAGTAIVIDTDPEGPVAPGGSTLAKLAADGPTRADLEPRSGAAAFLPNGGIEVTDAADIVAAFAARWPAVVLRCPPRRPRPKGSVLFAPLLPEPWGRRANGPTVYQRTPVSPTSDPGTLVLPTPRPGTIRSLIAGRKPPVRDRWLRRLAQVWKSA